MKKTGGFSDFEKTAMRERAMELKAEKNKESGEKAILAKIAEMPEPDRTMAKKVHAMVKEVAPRLVPKTWYGMPAYTRDEKVVIFFKAASKYTSRYATLGFEEAAKLDDGEMWPTSYALIRMTHAVEKNIAALIRKAAG